MDFTVRSESIDVEQIMEQIRARIREKRGVDYTEQQLRELAAVKLEKFLDPRGVRSDLLERFKERELNYDKPNLPLYTFEDTTIYETHRGPLQRIRRLLNPLLKLLFNPNPIIHALHSQAEINALYVQREEEQAKKRFEMESLYYEVIHNLVFELTRTGIEVKNLKMRVESLASRLEFNERRARALESVVAYRSESEDGDSVSRDSSGIESALTADAGPAQAGGAVPGEGPGQRSRRRRRRRGRRGGPPASVVMGAAPVGQQNEAPIRRPPEVTEETVMLQRPTAPAASESSGEAPAIDTRGLQPVEQVADSSPAENTAPSIPELSTAPSQNPATEETAGFTRPETPPSTDDDRS